MAILTSRLLWTLFALFALVVLGTVGYVLIEGQSLGDALYMTVITLTAVGYEEVWDLSPEGRASRCSSFCQASAGWASGSPASPHSS